MSGFWTARLALAAHAGSTGIYMDPDITLGTGVLKASVPDTLDAAKRLWELLMKAHRYSTASSSVVKNGGKVRTSNGV